MARNSIPFLVAALIGVSPLALSSTFAQDTKIIPKNGNASGSQQLAPSDTTGQSQHGSDTTEGGTAPAGAETLKPGQSGSAQAPDTSDQAPSSNGSSTKAGKRLESPTDSGSANPGKTQEGAPTVSGKKNSSPDTVKPNGSKGASTSTKSTAGE